MVSHVKKNQMFYHTLLKRSARDVLAEVLAEKKREIDPLLSIIAAAEAARSDNTGLLGYARQFRDSAISKEEIDKQIRDYEKKIKIAERELATTQKVLDTTEANWSVTIERARANLARAEARFRRGLTLEDLVALDRDPEPQEDAEENLPGEDESDIPTEPQPE